MYPTKPLLCLILLFNTLFCLGQKVIVSKIFLVGNEKTKDYIILRELNFKIGEEIALDSINKRILISRENLQNTSLFNKVSIDSKMTSDKKIEITIQLTERWYIWPIPYVKMASSNVNTWLKEKEFFRTFVGLDLTFNNYRGRNEQLHIQLQTGYGQKAGIRYKLPYVDNNLKSGLELEMYYENNKELWYNTSEQKRQFTRNDLKKIITVFKTGLNYSFRPKFYQYHKFGFYYNHIELDEKIKKEFNPSYLPQNTYPFFDFSYTYTFDKRDNRVFPLKGVFLKSILTSKGFVNEKLKADVVSNETELKYFVPTKKKVYFAHSITTKVNLTKQLPYFFQKGFGFNHFVRGYEYYVIDANQYLLIKNNINYALIEHKEINLGFIKSKKFNPMPLALYCSLFFDYGYSRNTINASENPLSNKSLFGYGFSLNAVTYYDKIIRFDLSINHLNEKAVFVHFVQPI